MMNIWQFLSDAYNSNAFNFILKAIVCSLQQYQRQRHLSLEYPECVPFTSSFVLKITVLWFSDTINKEHKVVRF